MKKEELVKMVDEICEEYGLEDSPACDLLEGMTRDQIIEALKAYNKGKI